MLTSKWTVAAAVISLAATAAGARQELLPVVGDTAPVHDPAAIKEKQTYYVFSTGGRTGEGVIPIRTSTDMRTWTLSGYVFPSLPAWALAEIPQARNAWAPDISFHNGTYRLYYSVSTFGSRNSAIGLATTRTLDRASAAYGWTDDGMVLRSYADKDDWNAIDPNVVVEGRDRVWLTWGSFWSGIKLRRLDAASGRLSTSDPTLYSLSSRPREPPIGGAVEAPFIVRHGDYWYLFVSFDRCCRGAASTYNVVVGRSRDIRGPYMDKAGTGMMSGGGTLVIAASGPAWRGPGHPGFLRDGRRDLMFFHAYFGEGRGRGSALQISTLAWQDGWPRAGVLP